MGVYDRSDWINNTDPALNELHLNNMENGIEMANMELNNSFWKAPVRAVTTAPVTLSGPQTVDQLVMAVGDRVLVKNQADPKQNGIYNVQTGAWTRAYDALHGAQWPKFVSVWCYNGMMNYFSTHYLNVSAGVTIGATELHFFRSFHDTVTVPFFATGRSPIAFTAQTAGSVTEFVPTNPGPGARVILDLDKSQELRLVSNIPSRPTQSGTNLTATVFRLQLWNSGNGTYENVFNTTADTDLLIASAGVHDTPWLKLPEKIALIRATRELRLMIVNGPTTTPGGSVGLTYVQHR